MSAPCRGSTSAKRPMQTVQQSSRLRCPPSALGFRGAGGKCHPIVRARDHIQTAELPKGSEQRQKRTVLMLPTLRDITAIPQSTPEKELVVTGRHTVRMARRGRRSPLPTPRGKLQAMSKQQRPGQPQELYQPFRDRRARQGVRPQRGPAGRAAQCPEGRSPLAMGSWTLST